MEVGGGGGGGESDRGGGGGREGDDFLVEGHGGGGAFLVRCRGEGSESGCHERNDDDAREGFKVAPSDRAG